MNHECFSARKNSMLYGITCASSIYGSEFEGKLQCTFVLARGIPHRILSEDGRLFVSGSIAKELFDGHVDFPDIFVCKESSLVLKLKDKVQTVRLNRRFINGEFHGKIPRWMGPTILVNRCFLGPRIAGDRGDHVDVHFG